MSRSNCDDCPRVRALEAEVAKVRRKVEELTRAGKRQAAPFSKGKPYVARCSYGACFSFQLEKRSGSVHLCYLPAGGVCHTLLASHPGMDCA